ncbi:MAG: hypothetical protein ACQETL_03600 [Bacteroidota bacterium]
MHEVTGKKEILNVFKWGHERVLKSLMQFTNKSFDLKTIKAKSLKRNELLNELEDIPFDEKLTLFKTEIIGDIFGKSYWLIDELASNYITNTDNNKQLNTNFSYEMLREVDNIISATLISQLSDHYSLKIYGDVPELLLPELNPLKEIVNSDFQKAKNSLFIYALEFQIKEAPEATCLFLWCVEEEMFLQE